MESGEGVSLRTKETPACETDKKETQMCLRQTRHERRRNENASALCQLEV